MATPDNKISNVFGSALPYWLKKQIATRSNYTNYGATSGQEDLNVLYRANKTAWIRVVSSININADDDTSLMTDMNYFKNAVGITDLKKAQDLAKKYVLFGGTSQYLNPNKSPLRSGLGLDGAYGMLGDKEIQTSGYRPMPGIIDAKIETQGKLGSVKMATISFKVWSKQELDIIDALYFKLGYTMLIEWGHTVFLRTSSDGNSASTFDSAEFYALDPFDPSLTKESIGLKIAKSVRDTEGNYDGMFGIVTNFTFSYNQDSGYDCVIKVIGLGALGDSLKINNNSNLPDVVNVQIKEYLNLIASEEAKKKEAELKAAAQQKFDSDKKQLESESKNDIDLPSYYTQTAKFANDGKTNLIYQSKINQTNDIQILYNNVKLLNFNPNDKVTQNLLNNNTIYLSTNDSFALGNFKSYIGTSDDQAKGTTVIIDFEYLDKILKINKLYPRINSYKDILVYNDSYNTVDKTKKEFEVLLTNPLTSFKSPPISVSNSNVQLDLRTTDYAIRNITSSDFLSTDIGGKTYIDLPRTLISYYIGGKNDASYEIELVLDLDAKPSSGKSIKSIFEKDPKTQLTLYTTYNIKDQIRDQISNNPTWQVQSSNIADNRLQRGIYKDDRIIDKPRLGMLLYKDITLNPMPALVTQTQKNGVLDDIVKTHEENVNYTLRVFLRINDASLIKDFKQNNQSRTLESAQLDLKNKQDQIAADNVKAQSQKVDVDSATITKQIESALQYQSNLELTINSIELYGLTQAVKDNHNLDIGKKVNSYSLSSKEHRAFINGLLQYGVFKDVIQDLFDNKINDDSSWNSGDNDYIKKLLESNAESKMRLYSKYGFSAAYMSAKSEGSDYNNRIKSSVPSVNYDDLTTIYVIPYEINQPMVGGGDIIHPVYIQLGFLLMLVNSMCTIYESEDGNSGSNKNRPVIYIDYNPETNFCLTNPLQLSTNAFDFLIPMQASLEDYEKLFSDVSLETVKGYRSISAPASGSIDPLFDPTKDDAISKTLPKFRDSSISGAYSGKTMKILVSCEYILGIIKEFSSKDGMNAVYLKPFLEQLIKDINKSFGGINIFRVSYDDSANCFVILDDQIQPLAPGEKAVTQDVTDQIPLFGVRSIAKSINIQTEIGSNLANMVAISANSNPADQSANSTNASSFGFINNSFKDRYIPVKKELSTDEIKKIEVEKVKKEKANYDSKIKVAQKFNDTVKTFYGKDQKPSKDDVSQATNYYIDKMSKEMNKPGPTRASAMIPIGVNFTTDGISGFNIGQAFTIPPDILPYTYSTRQTPTIKDVQNPTQDAKVAFATTGINHTIQANVWDTSIKGSMILIKDQNAFANGPMNKLNSTYTKQFVDVGIPKNLIANTLNIPNVVDGKLTVKATYYGYASDKYADTNSTKGIGNRNNKLIEGTSVAIKQSTAAALNLRVGDKILVTSLSGTTIGIYSYDDTVPEKDPGSRIDFYNPSAEKTTGNKTTFAFVDQNVILQKV